MIIINNNAQQGKTKTVVDIVKIQVKHQVCQKFVYIYQINILLNLDETTGIESIRKHRNTIIQQQVQL